MPRTRRGPGRNLRPIYVSFVVQRLKTRAQFQAVLAGNVIAKTEHFALHCNGSHIQVPQTCVDTDIGNAHQISGLFPGNSIWIGAMVPKRWAKRAVTRNAIKRQIYTVSADFLHNCPQVAFLVRLRKEFSRKKFPSATSSFLKETVRAEVIALMQLGSGPT